MTGTQDRRAHPRKPIELKVEYKRLNNFFADYTRNISKGGTFIKTRSPLPVGTTFVFHLHIPGVQKPIDLSGRVKYTILEGSEKAGEEPGMGIEFTYDSEECRLAVHRMMEDLLRESLGPHVVSQLQTTVGSWPDNQSDRQ